MAFIQSLKLILGSCENLGKFLFANNFLDGRRGPLKARVFLGEEKVHRAVNFDGADPKIHAFLFELLNEFYIVQVIREGGHESYVRLRQEIIVDDVELSFSFQLTQDEVAARAILRFTKVNKGARLAVGGGY